MRSVSKDYKPSIFKRRIDLINTLRKNILINESQYFLSSSEIELLALGLNYIPSNQTWGIKLKKVNKVFRNEYFPELKGTRMKSFKTLKNHFRRFTEQINWSLFWSDKLPGLRGYIPSSNLRNNIEKSNFSNHYAFLAPKQSWNKDKNVKQHCKTFCHNVLMEKLSQPNDMKIRANFVKNIAKRLIHQTDFFIIEADKGGAVVLWSKSDYEKEAIRQLSDTSTYEPINPESNKLVPSVMLENSGHEDINFYYSATNIMPPKDNIASILKTLLEKRDVLIDILENGEYISKKEAMVMRSGSHKKESETWNELSRGNSIDLKNDTNLYSLPYIYFKPKIHKLEHPETKTFQGRPIVATSRGPLFLLDKFVARLSSLLMRTMPGLLHSTEGLLERIRLIQNELQSKEFVSHNHNRCESDCLSHSNFPKTSNCITFCLGHEPTLEYIGLAKADVISLYPSIPWEDGILAAVDVYSAGFENLCKYANLNSLRRPVPPPLFQSMLRLIIENNYFTFQGRLFYRQRKGAAMGSCISVFFANSYMYRLTQNIIERPPSWLLLFERYIDDIFCVCCFHPSHGTNLLNNLIDSISNAHIKYTSSIGSSSQVMDSSPLKTGRAAKKIKSLNKKPSWNIRTCHFMDVSIFFDWKTQTFHSQPLIKPNTLSTYVHRSSNHIKHIFQNVAVSQMIRMKRLSSSRRRFLTAVKHLKKNLILRGYSKGELHRAMLKVERTGSYGPLMSTNLKKPNEKSVINISTKPVEKNINFRLIRPYNTNTDWTMAVADLNNINKSIFKHYQQSKSSNGKLKLISKSNSKIVYSRAGSSLSTIFEKQFKYGIHQI